MTEQRGPGRLRDAASLVLTSNTRPCTCPAQIKRVLSSGSYREFKFSCRGAAGIQNSMDNKDGSLLIDGCRPIGRNPGVCLTAPALTEAAAGSCYLKFMYSCIQSHKSKTVQKDSPPFLRLLFAPRVWLKPDAEISPAKVLWATQGARPGAWSARCRLSQPGELQRARMSSPGWNGNVENNNPEDGLSLSCETWNRTELKEMWKSASGFQFFSWGVNKRIMCN